MRSKCKVSLAFVAPFVLLPALLPADDFSIIRYTIDGGGAMHSSGGNFELSGTIGQPDARPESSGMAGGSFTLTGGFWFPLVPSDCNSDGSVDLVDYRDFEICLTGPQGGLAESKCACLDRDGDHDVDIHDVADFASSLQRP